MVFDPAKADGIGTNIVDVYARAELYLIRVIRDALIKAGESPSWAEAELLAIRQQRGRIQGIAAELQKLSPALWEDVTSRAFLRGQVEAEKELVGIPQLDPPSTIINDDAVYMLAAEQIGIMSDVHHNILRRTDDIWRAITAEATGYSLTGSMTTFEAAQRAFTRMARDGMGFFVDKRGRKWGLDTYAEMAVRSATTQALRAGHSETLQQWGVDLVVVSSHKNPAPQCAPYERRVLSLSGKYPAGTHRIGDNIVRVTATMRDAEAHGLHHPNAILGGDQTIDTFAGAVGASKATYRGPAVTIRTAQGNSFTVSPEHPILTGRGWVTAESISTSDYVFNTRSGDRFSADTLASANVNDVPPTVEDEFVALKSSGTSSRIPSAGHNFDDDRQFLQGEIDVVVTDDCLLPVPDTKIVKETGEVYFTRANMCRVSEIANGPLALGGRSVFKPVGRALSNSDTGSDKPAPDCGAGRVEHGGNLLTGHPAGVHVLNALHVDDLIASFDGWDSAISESFTYGRAGDSHDPADVCGAVPSLVEPDYVVNVDRGTFVGHAYDFQTVDGIYSINGIISHNCRHSHAAYIPGHTRIDLRTPPQDDTGYKATQKQRYYERQIRASKRMEEAAITNEASQKAKQRKRQYQAKLRAHINKHDLPRRRHREQLMKPAKGAVGVEFRDGHSFDD